MKSVLLLIIAFFVAGVMLSQQKLDIQTIKHLDKIQQHFNTWKQSMKKQYKSPELELYRMSIFADNLALIEQSNSIQSEYKLGLTAFADLTQEEFSSLFLSKVEQENNEQNNNLLDFEIGYEIPNRGFTWQDKGVLRPVQNQGTCQSTWAITTTGVVEGYWAIQKGSLPNLSQQQLLDCVTIDYGCQGCAQGNTNGGLRWVKKNGVTTVEDYPINPPSNTCNKETGPYKVKQVKQGTGCATLTMQIQQQPTAVNVDAQNWFLYTSGVFSNCAKVLNHGVLAVGYDAAGNWILKNSWGTSWGNQGYITIKNGDTCGVCQIIDNVN